MSFWTRVFGSGIAPPSHFTLFDQRRIQTRPTSRSRTTLSQSPLYLKISAPSPPIRHKSFTRNVSKEGTRSRSSSYPSRRSDLSRLSSLWHTARSGHWCRSSSSFYSRPQFQTRVRPSFLLPQGYLSRELRDQLHLHVLALDWSDVQTQGAARREASKLSCKGTRRRSENDNSADKSASSIGQSCPPVTNGSLTYITTSIDPESLVSSTKGWLEDISPVADHVPAQATPVLFVALHACGSLTPDILRAFASVRKPNSSAPSAPTTWMPQGAIVVGCCYNMMRSEGWSLVIH